AAGRPIDVFIPTWANPSIVAELESLGAQIHVCERKKGQLGDPCMVEFHKAIESGSLPFGVQATENILTLDGGRTIGWELAEAFEDNPADDLFIQVGGGALLTSCAIGLFEAAKFGKLSKVPKIWAVQSEGCAPFDAAWKRIPTEKPVEEVIEYCQRNQSELMQPWANPTSIATGILDDITYDWIGVARSLLLSKGGSVVAREDQIVQASELVPKIGIQTEPTGAASVAGAINAFEAGQIDARTVIAVLLTGKDRSVNQGLD
ncbi:MAG: pyridoxal-phosphate dependent enzyme, partial [Actinomycetota bacterium]|nr:pyridoxal-phosphate dependent enzyme [Actinomycetota bacterium]